MHTRGCVHYKPYSVCFAVTVLGPAKHHPDDDRGNLNVDPAIWDILELVRRSLPEPSCAGKCR